MQNYLKTYFVFVFLIFLFFSNLKAQEPFSIEIKQVSLTEMPGVHSGAFAQYEGKWIFIGGRKNGLHGFQPPFAFPFSGINDSIFIVDPVLKQQWKAAVDTLALPDNIREAITSTNMQFYQQDSILYMIGGYGWKDSIQNFQTFATLTAINIPQLIKSITQGKSFAHCFRQISDARMAITGGNVEKLDSTYYLIFGHTYNGYYSNSVVINGSIQKYSYQIRKFQIKDDGANLQIKNYQAITDSSNFRRRDFNLVPQIFPDKKLGFTAFTGVFRPTINLPYLNTIDIHSSSHNINNNFNQYLSHYQSAFVPIHDSISNTMHTVFFGGISMYYFDTITQKVTVDSLVPFVNTISHVTRKADGSMEEFRLPITMPALLGCNAMFMLDPNIKNHHNSIVELNTLNGKTKIGYIVGGIETPEPNISYSDASLTKASRYIFEVYIDKTITSANQLKTGNTIFNVLIFPNPINGLATIEFSVAKSEWIDIHIFDSKGVLIETLLHKKTDKGTYLLKWESAKHPAGVYFCQMRSENQIKSISIIKQ